MENNESESLEDELSSFRRQWQQELQQNRCTSSQNITSRSTAGSTEEESLENRAKMLFLNGVALEKERKLPEAIRYYRQAIQLVPDIESRISEFIEEEDNGSSQQDDLMREFNENKDETLEETGFNLCLYRSKELEDVVKEFDKIRVTGICEPKFPSSQTHISALPAELLMYIFKWVVSVRLDLRSLEKLSQVCKGFYALARDPEIWRLSCVRIWGVNLGSVMSWNGSWREMFLKRAHLSYNGVYISRISYTRPSEPTFEQQCTPYQLIIYYRYLRFFTDGTVLFLTSSDEPQVSVSKLLLRPDGNNVWNGNYRLVGNKVLLLIQKVDSYGQSSSRRRGKKQVQPGGIERVFHMEMELQNTKKRRNSKLSWVQYTCQTFCRISGSTTTSHFDMNNEQFCPFYFSRVKSYESSVCPLF